jgi:hypothetical protein
MASRLSATTAALLFSGFMVGTAVARCDDPAAAEVVRARIASTCVCTAATKHGRYVSCVAHEVRDAVQRGELPTNCKGTVTRCAARSTCGKRAGFVTCCFARAGTCDAGLCQDGTTPCLDASQCPAVTKCRTKSSADHCVVQGGTPGSGSCCDAVCSVTP